MSNEDDPMMGATGNIYKVSSQGVLEKISNITSLGEFAELLGRGVFKGELHLMSNITPSVSSLFKFSLEKIESHNLR